MNKKLCIRDVVERVALPCARLFIERGMEVVPTAFIIRDRLELAAMPWRDAEGKRRAQDYLRELSTQPDVEQIVLVTDAYTADIPAGDVATFERCMTEGVKAALPPEKRGECLAVAIFKRGAQVMEVIQKYHRGAEIQWAEVEYHDLTKERTDA